MFLYSIFSRLNVNRLTFLGLWDIIFSEGKAVGHKRAIDHECRTLFVKQEISNKAVPIAHQDRIGSNLSEPYRLLDQHLDGKQTPFNTSWKPMNITLGFLRFRCYF